MFYSKNNFFLVALILCTYISTATPLGTPLIDEDTSFTHCDTAETTTDSTVDNDIQNICTRSSTTYEQSTTEDGNYTVLKESYFDHETGDLFI